MLSLVLGAVVLALSWSVRADDPVVSTMIRGGVAEATEGSGGYRLVPVREFDARYAGMLSRSQAFEVLRPDMEAFELGRLGTSCSCVVLEAGKRSFAAGERAILRLHNVLPTPPNGAYYEMYVQVSGAAKATLKAQALVKSVWLPPELRPERVYYDSRRETPTREALHRVEMIDVAPRGRMGAWGAGWEFDRPRFENSPVYARTVTSPMSENYRFTNRTIRLTYKGREALFDVNPDTGKLRLKGYCGDSGIACYAGDNTIVIDNKLLKYNGAIKKLDEICDCTDIACGCDELNIIVAKAPSGKDAVYGRMGDARDNTGVSILGYCDDLLETCQNRYWLTDIVLTDGIRYQYDPQRNGLAPQCFCTTAGCKCPGYNPPTLAKPAVRVVKKKDKVVIDDDIWEVCECWELDCLGCYDEGASAEEKAAMQQLQRSGTYYDENGQARTGGSGFSEFGKALGIARGVMSFIK